MALNIMKLVRVISSIFYGHLIAVAVYDLIIGGIVDWIADSVNNYYFNIARILLGLVLIALSVLTILILSKKKFKILYVCGGVLALALAVYVAIYTLYLSFNFQQLDTYFKYSMLVECIIKALVIAGGVALTFLMAARGPYTLVDQSTARGH
jgi:hypothetical protein